MRKEFVEYLVSQGVLPSSGAGGLRNLLRGAPEPIGSIAFSYGMITGPDIDAILDDQRQTHSPFGEIARNMGMLTRAQIETLLHIQQVRAATEIAEALALSGLCSPDDMMAHLAQFFAKKSKSPVHAKG